MDTNLPFPLQLRCINWIEKPDPKVLHSMLHTIYQHNEINDYHKPEYKSVQLKIRNHQVCLMGFGKSADEVMLHFNNIAHDLQNRINARTGKSLQLRSIEKAFTYECFYFSEKPETYKITNWNALNKKNLARFKKLFISSEEALKKEKYWQWTSDALADFLKPILYKHIEQCTLALTERPIGADFYLDLSPEIQSRRASRYGNQGINFNIKFSCNWVLPEWLGIGNGVKIGFGTIRSAIPNRY